MKKIVALCWVAALFQSCELGRDLEVQNMGESPGYFVECYCQPDEMYELTATRIAPISEDQYLDYSLEFDVHVVAEERIKLYHSLYTKPGSKRIYNYASNRRLSRVLCDSVYLDVIAPGGERITGVTAIPDEVELDTAYVSGSRVCTRFYTSQQQEQNFYILAVFAMTKGKESNRHVYRMGYCQPGQWYEKMHEIDHIDRVDSIVVRLKRITEPCYRYQLSMEQAGSANNDNITSPIPLLGNLAGAMGIFTCYTEDQNTLYLRAGGRK